MPIIRVRHDFDPATISCVWRDPGATAAAWRAYLEKRWADDLRTIGIIRIVIDVAVESPGRRANRPCRQAEITVTGCFRDLSEALCQAAARALTPENDVFKAFLANERAVGSLP